LHQAAGGADGIRADLTVVVPTDRAQTRAAVRWAYAHDGPSYLRIPRFKVPDVIPENAEFSPGRALVLREGDDITLVAIGTLVSRALIAADRLAAEGISARVINTPFVDPLDKTTILAATETRGIVVAEEATVSGGLGAAVASLTGNRVLQLALQTSGAIVSHHVLITADPRDLRDTIDHDHSLVARAIMSGHPRKAATQMATHIRNVAEYFQPSQDPDDLIDWR
jgi:transketolase C-terminal domain/subunit